MIALLFIASQVAFSPAEVDGVFTEPAAAIKEGISLLEGGLTDEAMQKFRQTAKSGQQKAVGEYNVGRALMKKADIERAEAGAGKMDPATKDIYAQAAKAFASAYGLSDGAKLQSKSALAEGNAYLRAEKMPEAIDAYRRSLVSDGNNGEARRNLARSLRYVKMQPPPPPSSSDDDKEGDEDEQKQGEQQEQKQGEQQEQKQGEQDEEGEGEQKQGEDKGEQKPGDKGEQKPQEQKQDKGKDEKGDQAKEDKGEQQPGGQPGKQGESDKEKAKRMLDRLRRREKPLDPRLMKKAGNAPRSGKTW